MTEQVQDPVTFWEDWYRHWWEMTGGGPARPMARAIEVIEAWTRLAMPAMEPDYAMPDWWLALSPAEKRAGPRPRLS
jgi:hypothetical protein